MEIKCKLLFLLFFTSSFLFGQVSNADYNITVTPPGGIVACDINNTAELVHIVAKRNGLANFKITFTLPTGIEYVTGTVLKTAGPAGLTIAEDATSTATTPVFNISGTWAQTNVFDFTFTRRAGCSAINYSIAGGSFKDKFSASYTGGTASPLVDIDPAIAPYNINTAVLSVQTIATATANLGDVITPRNITVVQGGNGCTRSMVHKVVIADTVATIDYVLSYGGTPLVPASYSTTDTLYFPIDFTVAPFNAAVGGNGCFDNGETITFQESFKVQRCSSEPVRHIATYGCSAGQVCYTSASQPGNIIFGSQLPNITFAFTSNTVPSAGQMNICTANHVEVVVTNTNTNAGAAATDVLLIVGYAGNNVNPSSYDNPKLQYRTSQYATSNFAVNGVSVPSVRWNNIQALASLNPGGNNPEIGIMDTLTFDPDGPGVGLEDLDGDGYYDDLGPGQSFTFSYDITTQQISADNACVPLNTGWDKQSYVHNYVQQVHKTQCGTPRVGSTLDKFYENFGKYTQVSDWDVPTDIDGPSGANFTVKIYPNWQRNGWHCGGTSAEKYQVRIPLPVGITYDGVTAPNLPASLNPSYFMDGDTLVYQLEGDYVAQRNWFDFPLTIDCGLYQSTQLTLSYETRFICDGCVEWKINCGTFPTINTHCPSPCKGPVTRGFDANRTTAGWTDATQTTKVVLDPNTHNTKAYLAGDTMQIKTYMYMNDTAVSDLRFVMNYNGSPILTFLGGTIDVKDNSSGSVVSGVLTAPSYSTSGTNRNYEFNLSSFSTLVSPTYQFGEGNEADTVWLTINMLVPKSPQSVNSYPLVNFLGRFISINPGVDTVSCDYYGDVAKINSPYIYNTEYINNLVFNECGSAYFTNTLWSRIDNPSSFPGEYRPYVLVNSITFNLPDYVEYIPNSASISGYYGGTISGAAVTTTWDPGMRVLTLTPTNPQLAPNFWSNLFRAYIYLDVKCGAPSALIPSSNVYSSNINAEVYLNNAAVQENMTYNGYLTNLYTYVQPTFTLQSPLPVSQGVQSNISWDVQVDKTSTGNTAYNWLRIEQLSGIQISGVYAVNGGVETLLTTTSQGGFLYVQLGAMNGLSTFFYRIKATYNDCDNQSFNVNIGFGCQGYPLNYTLVDSNYCYQSDITLGIESKSSIAEIHVDQSSINVPVSMCNPFNINLDVISLDEANIENPVVSLTVPGGIMALNVNSVNVEYPAGSGDIQSVSTSIVSGKVVVNLMDHTTIDSIGGIYGTTNSQGIDGRKVNITINAQINCDFVANSRLKFEVYGTRPCGVNINGSYDFSKKITVNGLESNYEIFHNINTPTHGIEGCSELDTVKIISTIFSSDTGSVTGTKDSLKITLPESILYLDYACNSAICPTFVSSIVVNGLNEILFSIPPDLVNGDIIDVDLVVTSNLGGCDSNAIIEVSSYVATTGVSCGATACSNVFLETGNQQVGIIISKPNYFLNVGLVTNSISGISNSITAYYNIDNSNSNIRVNSNVVVEAYYDANMNGLFDLSTDVFLGSKTYSDTIGAYSTVLDTIVFSASSNQLQNLIIVAREDQNACICANFVAELEICFIDNLPYTANSVCLGDSVFLYLDSTEIGKTYQLYNETINSFIGSPISGNGATIMYGLAGSTPGSNVYKIHVVNTSLMCSGFMKDSVSIIVTDPNDIGVDAGNDTTLCFTNFATDARNLLGVGVWEQIDSNPSLGISGSSNPIQNIVFQEGLIYQLEWCATSNNCTSCDTMEVKVSPSAVIQILDTTICQGQAFTLNGINYNQTGTYYDTLYYALSGCDSIQYILNLQIDSFELLIIDTTICQGQIYTLNGTNYNQTGTYYDTLVYAQSGCDSIQYVLNLQIDSFELLIIDTTICQGQTYTLNGINYNQTGTYYDTLNYTQSGCDSMQFVLSLKVDSIIEITIDTTICQGDVYTLNGINYNQTGTYYDTLYYTQSGCDSIQYELNLQIDSVELLIIDTTICQGQTYTLNGINYNQTGTYYDTLNYTQSGCDSIQYILNLRVDSVIPIVIDTTICQGEIYMLNGNAYTSNGIYFDTLYYSTSGCDSVQFVLDLQIDSFEIYTIDTTICQGDVYTLNGINYNQTGTYYDTLVYAQSGCDSIQYELNLQIDSFELLIIDTTICQGQTYTLNGINYNQTGTYYDTLNYTQSGCDSMQFILNLKVDSIIEITIDTTICQGEIYMLNGNAYTSNGTYFDTLYYSTSGCDSVQYILDLQIDSFEVYTIDTTICQGDVYTLNGINYNQTGTYYDTLYYTQSGCDSMQFILNLKVDSIIEITIDTTICQGEIYILNGNAYTSNGIYFDTLYYSTSGCDSVQYILDLQIDSFEVYTIDTTICQGDVYTLNGINYNQIGTYYDTLYYTQSGCDSIQYELNLQIDSFELLIIDTTICQGQTYTLNGINYNQTGTYYDTLNYTPSGCDSMQFILNLKVDSIIEITIDTTICQGEIYILNGNAYTSNGIYFDTLYYSASGCDSAQFVLNLQIDSFEVYTIYTTICQGDVYTLNGINYNQTGTYYDTLVYAQSDCDSIQYILNLRVDSVIPIVIDTTICQGQTYTLNGINYNQTGTYYDTLNYTQSGCDSIQYILNLRVDSVIPIVIDTTICQGEIYTLNGNTYTSNGTYFDTIYYSASGCDSAQFVLNLQIDSIEVYTIDTTICQGQTYTLNGINYNQTGMYYDTLVYAQSGCDSIQYILNLRVDSVIPIVIDTTICQGQIYTLNGTNYNQTGTYYDTIVYAQSGCDSIQYVLNLQIDSFGLIIIDTTICQGQTYTLNGINYNQTGTYYDTLNYTQSGCDSIQYVLNLQIDSFELIIIDTTICQGQTYTLNGINYNQTGTYYDTLNYTQSGCDSAQFVLNLKVDSVIPITIDTTICQGDVFVLNGINYNQMDTYYDTLYYAQSGCDSVYYTLNLIVDSFTVETIDTTICQGDVIILNGESYNQTGIYYDTLHYAQSGCDSVQYILNLDVKSVQFLQIPASICEGDTFTFNGVNYTTSGTYYDTTRYSAFLCDSIQYEIDLTVNSLPNVTAIASPNDTVCENQNVVLTGSGAASYVWSNGIQNAIAFNPAVGLTSYMVEGIDNNGCINYDTIIVVGLATADTTLSYTICENEFHSLPDGTLVNTEGLYTTIIPRLLNGCDSVITTQLNVNHLGVFEELEDIAVCFGLSQTIGISASNMISYEWFVNDGSGFVSLIGNMDYLGATTNSLSFNLDTLLNNNTYGVQMADECGNTYFSTSLLEVFVPHLVENPIADTLFCLHEIDVINVDYNGHDYVWNTGEIGPYILPEHTGEYIVDFVENHTNCLMSDTIFVTLEDCIGNCVVLAPTGFSPDGNGTNDIFRVVTSCGEGFDYYLFNVYNRWGELIFTTNDWRQGWDGTYKGRDAEIDVYTYYVEYTKSISGEKGNIKGSVTLVR